MFSGISRCLWPVEGRGCKVLSKGSSSLKEIYKSFGYQCIQEAFPGCLPCRKEAKKKDVIAAGIRK